MYFLYRKYSIGKILCLIFRIKTKLRVLHSCRCIQWFLSAKGFKNAFRSCPNSSEDFPDFSGIYSHFL
jgi:hypothetical protein